MRRKRTIAPPFSSTPRTYPLVRAGPAVSPHLVRMKDVILRLDGHMTSPPAPRGTGFIHRESRRRRVIIKLRIPPSAGVRKSLAVLLHEEEVCQRVGHIHGKLRFLALLRLPLDLGDLGALGKRLAVARNARLVGRNDRGIAQDHFHPVIRLRTRDELPVSIALEVGERDATRQLQGVPVLLGNGQAAHYREHEYAATDPQAFAVHPRGLLKTIRHNRYEACTDQPVQLPQGIGRLRLGVEQYHCAIDVLAHLWSDRVKRSRLCRQCKSSRKVMRCHRRMASPSPTSSP